MAWQTKLFIVSSVDITDEFITLGIVSLRGELQGFFKRITASQGAAQPKKCSPSNTAN